MTLTPPDTLGLKRSKQVLEHIKREIRELRGDEMGIQDLPIDEQRRVYWTLEWTTRMAQRYGGTVYEKGGKSWDWGQALCRECYGPNWNNLVPETPTWNDLATAKRWEEGKIPEWVDQELMKRRG